MLAMPQALTPPIKTFFLGGGSPSASRRHADTCGHAIGGMQRLLPNGGACARLLVACVRPAPARSLPSALLTEQRLVPCNTPQIFDAKQKKPLDKKPLDKKKR